MITRIIIPCTITKKKTFLSFVNSFPAHDTLNDRHNRLIYNELLPLARSGESDEEAGERIRGTFSYNSYKNAENFKYKKKQKTKTIFLFLIRAVDFSLRFKNEAAISAALLKSAVAPGS